MRSRFGITTRFALLLMISVTLFSSCSKGYREVVIVDDSNASLRVLMEGSAPREKKLWQPGRVVLFKTDCLAMFPEPLPLGNNTYFGGLAGHMYELDDNLKPKDIGTFDLKLSDTELLQRYGK